MLQCMFSGKDEFVLHQPIESSSLISFSLNLPFSQADGTSDYLVVFNFFYHRTLGLPETELKVLQIDCTLPRDYPSKQPPQITVSSQGFLGIESHREFLKLLAEELQAGGTLFTQGEPCIHGAIQWIQDNVLYCILIALKINA